MMCGAVAVRFGDAVALVDARLVSPSRLIAEATAPKAKRCVVRRRFISRVILYLSKGF
jgi:hypothetical protein